MAHTCRSAHGKLKQEDQESGLALATERVQIQSAIMSPSLKTKQTGCLKEEHSAVGAVQEAHWQRVSVAPIKV